MPPPLALPLPLPLPFPPVALLVPPTLARAPVGLAANARAVEEQWLVEGG
jgi:hypothetical protein